jgi:hypothetical protein
VGEVPLGEDRESYAVDIISGSNVVRTLTSTTPSALYASSDEILDFGGPQTIFHVRVAQLSATVGRGIAAEAILTT